MDGVVIFNIGGAINGKASGFLRAELKTYRDVFPHVFLFKVDKNKGDSEIQNLIIAAVKSDGNLTNENKDSDFYDLLSRRREFHSQGLNPALTDDLAPVEYYNSFAQN